MKSQDRNPGNIGRIINASELLYCSIDEILDGCLVGEIANY